MADRYTGKQAKAIIAECLKAGRVSWSGHALERMDKRGIDAAEVLRVLRGGVVRAAEFEGGSWRHQVAAGRVVVVVTLREDSTLVVTAMKAR